MKKIILPIAFSVLTITGYSQDFKQNITTAKTNYGAGNLQETHFALLQIMQDLDITLGKEIMKLFPVALDTLKIISNQDNVSGASGGFAGVTVQRNYGVDMKRGELNIIINSPVLTGLNAYLNSPIMGAFGGDPNTKLIKVSGFKGKLIKENASEDQRFNYRIEIPVSNALFTLQVSNSNEKEILAMANAVPLGKIASLLQ